VEFTTIGRDNTRTFLSTMLKSEESEEGKAGYVLIGSVSSKNTATFVQSYLPLFCIPASLYF
jgi:hypothetical protein